MEIVDKQNGNTSKSKSWEVCVYSKAHDIHRCSIRALLFSLFFKWRIRKLLFTVNFVMTLQLYHGAIINRNYFPQKYMKYDHRSIWLNIEHHSTPKFVTIYGLNFQMVDFWIDFVTCIIQKIIISFDLESKNYNYANLGWTHIFYVF